MASPQLQEASRGKILIVEDEALIADSLRTTLLKLGYEVTGVADSYEETLAEILKIRPHLILMDIRIRGLIDGVDTAAKVREQFEIPLIFLSGQTDSHTIDRAKRTGASCFLPKPVHNVTMAASIEMAIHKHQDDQTYSRGKSDLERTTAALRVSEALVKQTEDRFHLLVEGAPNALIMVGADGMIALVNAQTEKLFGYARGDLLGQPIEMLLPERFRQKHSGLRAGFLAAPGMRAMGQGRELFARRRDGSEVPIEIGLNPIKTADGQFVVASIIDISERISYQRERDQLISRLEGALKEKTVLLQEVHHRVKNNLAVVAAFLRMQADSVADERLTMMLEKSQQRVASIALIHEYLYSGDLDHVNFGQYARKLIDELRMSYATSDRVSISTEAEEINLPMDCAIPCGLILNELVSNTLKHAFPDDRGGKITVRFCRLETGELSLSCQDDGVGIPESLDWETAPSLGLRIIQILTKQLKGKLRLDRSKGTQFELTFREIA